MRLCYRKQKYTTSCWGDKDVTAEDRELLEIALTLTRMRFCLALDLLLHWCQLVLSGSAKKSAFCVWDNENLYLQWISPAQYIAEKKGKERDQAQWDNRELTLITQAVEEEQIP